MSAIKTEHFAPGTETAKEIFDSWTLVVQRLEGFARGSRVEAANMKLALATRLIADVLLSTKKEARADFLKELEGYLWEAVQRDAQAIEARIEKVEAGEAGRKTGLGG